MSFDYDIGELAEQLSQADNRPPSRIANGYHVAGTAGSIADLAVSDLGFYTERLDADYHDLADGEYAIVQPLDGGQSQQMKITGLDAGDVNNRLSDDAYQSFIQGNAVVAGPDHHNRDYSPWNVDDRIQRDNVDKSGVFSSGTRIQIREYIDISEINEDLMAVGKAMAEYHQRSEEDYEMDPTRI